MKLRLFVLLNICKMRTQYQFINWFPEWQGFHLYRPDYAKTDMALIYEWMLDLGWWEVRRWRSAEGAMQMLEGKEGETMSSNKLRVVYESGVIDIEMDNALEKLLARYGYARWASGMNPATGERDLAFEKRKGEDDDLWKGREEERAAVSIIRPGEAVLLEKDETLDDWLAKWQKGPQRSGGEIAVAYPIKQLEKSQGMLSAATRSTAEGKI